MINDSRQRRGFTLAELLVATALIVLIMSILSDAFSEGLKSFRHLKSTGDLQERLRSAASILRRDLLAHHFNGNRKLSSNPPQIQTLPFPSARPPNQGFFYIESLPWTREGGISDVDGIPSFRATGDRLHFTVNLRGTRPEDYFIGSVPSPDSLERQGPTAYEEPGQGIMRSQWAEVAYFLRATGERAGNTPLYSLHRRGKLLVENSATVPRVPDTLQARIAYADVSFTPTGGQLRFNDPRTVQPFSQRGFNVVPAGPPRHNPQPIGFDEGGRLIQNPGSLNKVGDDLLMTDVISFQIEAMYHRVNSTLNPRFERIRSGSYDSERSPRFTLYDRIRALKITMRIWDFKVEQTRQITIVQDM